jgi:hypothetical protein
MRANGQFLPAPLCRSAMTVSPSASLSVALPSFGSSVTSLSPRGAGLLGDFGVGLEFAGVDGFFDFLRARHLLGGVADEQRHRAEQDDHPGQPP